MPRASSSSSPSRAAPIRLAVEDELLERIIHPLLDNAVQYGERAGLGRADRNGTTAIINVVDDGAGVDAAERDAIFEPGVRGSSASTKPGGAGLGLALAKRLARSAGGTIVVMPSEEGGQFSVHLPMA